MQALGANVVRIHLQLGKLMSAADTPNERALAQLRRLLKLAEETGLYLDISFYWGRTVPEYAAATERKEIAALVGGWLKYFQAHGDFMKRP